MSKSILVIDTPENCTECPLELDIADIAGKTLLNVNICRGCGHRNMDSTTKPDWCPLKEMPEKEDLSERDENYIWSEGWNACIDEIMKERE